MHSTTLTRPLFQEYYCKKWGKICRGVARKPHYRFKIRQQWHVASSSCHLMTFCHSAIYVPSWFTFFNRIFPLCMWYPFPLQVGKRRNATPISYYAEGLDVQRADQRLQLTRNITMSRARKAFIFRINHKITSPFIFRLQSELISCCCYLVISPLYQNMACYFFFVI